MAYYENITAGRGAIDSFANALNSQRFANLMLNETISNFSNNINRAGALFDEARIREDVLKYQRMQDFFINKRKDEAFELEKKQAELNMDFAKRRQRMSEETHKQEKILNDHRAKAMGQENRLNERHFRWLMEVIPNNKAIVAANNKANNTPITPITPITPKKTITKKEFQALYANPMFRY
ncbi:hypothetical protein KVK95_07375 [Helicobacter pylori]|uniref:hypothetical protein n=1 Tax=Helicobacter pylori TaxID=210 RepID=UPI000EB42004|nr:hypothetical protein [Helicobacter pylori]RKV37949.1 hypothetical protein DEE33_07275 [Helicobacter pylori]WQX75404.1 hypothetical protein KVK95_07375 [Helicobacter pylori]